jgi:hypothetical protein
MKRFWLKLNETILRIVIDSESRSTNTTNTLKNLSIYAKSITAGRNPQGFSLNKYQKPLPLIRLCKITL